MALQAAGLCTNDSFKVVHQLITAPIGNIVENNKTGIYVTHNINEATAIADYIYVLNEGKLVGIYTPKEFATSDNEIVKSLLVE